jgi:hypothetical protein
MNAGEPASTGAAEISVFHQFVGGKSGGGPGTLASRRGAIWTVSTAAASGGQIAEAGAPAASRAAAAIDAFTPKSLVMVSAEIMEFQRFRDTCPREQHGIRSRTCTSSAREISRRNESASVCCATLCFAKMSRFVTTVTS